ncbi:protein PAXX isoform X2 [Larimichthys crocea]|uniref:protein PAXX isoform X2 n=1 Tax=Larimichthys crocea TaxID=215358 RepID=UPI000F5E97F8|nr:protein PAXX isoform X2 [Larimichthys crocea]
MPTAVKQQRRRRSRRSCCGCCSQWTVGRIMDVKQASYCVVLDKKSQSKFICYTRRKNGLFHICLTDAADVWSTEYTEDTLNQFRQRFALKSTEDYILKLRSACGNGDVSVVVHETSVELRVGCSPGGVSSVSPVKNHQWWPAGEQLMEPLLQQNSAPSATVKKRPPGSSLINPGSKRKQRATGVAFDDADED